MLSIELAARVARACAGRAHRWEPRSGDRFVLPDRGIDEVFVVSEMTIEVVDLPTDRIVRFNGTTEWALDSISADEVLWIPWEHQLRELIGLDGAGFVALARIAGAEAGGVAASQESWAVTLTDGSRFTGPDAETAYARAVVGDQSAS